MKHINTKLLETKFLPGEVMGMLCRRVGPSIYEDTKDVIMQGVVTNLERQPMIEPSASGHVDTEKLAEKLTGSTSGSDADGSISPGTSPTRRVCWSLIYHTLSLGRRSLLIQFECFSGHIIAESMRKLCVAYNNVFRFLCNEPRDCSASYMFV